MKWITALLLENWAQTETARAKLPALIADLVRASAREIGTIRFPSGDKSQIHGFDGHLIAAGVPSVQDGESLWELGTSEDYIAKANSDIKDRSQQTSSDKRATTSFVFATPRTWNESGENELQKWRERKRQQFGWKEVVVIDGVMMEHWLEQSEAVASRYARYEFGVTPKLGARSTEEFWQEYASRFKAPLTEQVLLCERDEAKKEVLKRLRSGAGKLVLRADSPDEAIAFAIATIRTADAEVRQFLESRTIVLDTDEAARELSQRKDLIFIPRGSVTISGLLARTAATVVGVGRDHPDSETYLRLESPTAHALAETITTTMGVPEEEARLVARVCGRSVTILARTFANGDARLPEWATGERTLVPALLAGAWDAALGEDKNILSRLAAVDTYEKYEEQLRRFRRMQDPPIDCEDRIWKIRAPVDAFVHLAHLLGDEDFTRLKAAAIEVFSEINSSLDAPTPPDSFQQVKLRHSLWLRDGLATTLLLFAVHHQGAELRIAGTSPQAFVDDLVNRLPGLSSDWRLIASLRAELPLLMEAAPRPFLSAIERLLEGDGNQLKPIFREGGFFSSASPHTYLLWGLEVLAWDPEYLAEVSVILAKLATIDPGGTLSNRPINTLLEIFRPWHPNTNASQEQRLATLDMILREVPEIGWTLISKLLPTTHSVGQFTAKPKYRESGASERELLTRGMLLGAYEAVVEKAFVLADDDPERWSYLVRDFTNFSPALRSKMSGLLEDFLESVSGESQQRVWTSIRNEVNRHKAYKEAKWALPAEDLVPLSRLVERFAPNDPTAKVGWLFDDQFPHLPDNEEGSPEKVIAEARKHALIELMSSSGTEGILAFAESVKLPHLVAYALPSVIDDMSIYDRLLAASLSSGAEKLTQFGAALSGVAAFKFPDEWGEVLRARVSESDLSAAETVSLLQYWPDKRSTWDFITSFGTELEKTYWSTKQAWPIRGDLPDLLYAAEHYMSAGRCIAAIQSLGEAAGTLPVDVVFRLLNSAVTELNEDPKAASGMLTYYLEQILDTIEKRGVANTSQIAQIEWAFFPLFEHGRRRLKLHQVMLEDPKFYFSLLCAVFRAEGEEPSEPTAEQRARATAAYNLLRSFASVPGVEGETVNAELLRSWVNELRRLGEEGGRRGMTNEFIGHVLAHAPKDPKDEARPHRAMRDLLEELKSDETERGVSIERFNMRGVYSKALFEGGKQERGFAEQARSWAAKCNSWPRTQRLLNQIAKEWDRHADWEDSEARKDRMRD